MSLFSQANDLHSIAGGVLALKELGQLSAEDKAQSLSKMMSLMTADGTFKNSPVDATSSVQNVHLALEMLEAISSNTDGSDLAVDVFEKAFQLIPGGENDAAKTDALLMVPLSKLTDKKLRLVGQRLVTVTDALLALKHSTCLVDRVKVYDALKLITAYKASPLYMSLEKSEFDVSSPASHKLQLSVLSVLGEKVEVESAEVVTIKNTGKDSVLFQGEKLVDGVLDMGSASLVPGRYIVQIILTIAGRPKPTPFQTYIVVTDKVSVGAVQFGVSDGSESAELQSVSAQNSLHDVTASAMAGDKLHVSFELSALSGAAAPRKPHQTFVRITHQVTGQSVYVVSKKSAASAASGALSYSAVVSTAEHVKAFDHQSGRYTLSILVGDAAYASPVEYVLGTVDLVFPAKQVTNLPLYAKSLLHTSDTTHTPLPEITHVMRPPAQRASNFMATVFTALTVAPLAVFVIFVLSLRPNLARMGSLASLLAVGSFTLMLVLYVSYWLALKGVSFYDTIKYLCFLAPVTMVLGSYSLQSVEAMRLKAEAVAVTTKAKQN